MTNFIIYALIGVVVGVIFTIIILTPKLKVHKELNNKIEKENKELEHKNIDLKNELKTNSQMNEFLEHEISVKQIAVSNLEQSANLAADTFLKDKMAIAESNFEQSMYEMAEQLRNSREDYLEQYENIMRECAEALDKYFAESTAQREELTNALMTLRSQVDAAVEANKRQQQIETENNFYRLNLTDVDKEEIQKLRSVLPYLRDKEPLNKVIWKVYYEKPYTSMIGRVVGQGKHTGIYKITNLENQMCYVGQAVDIAARWKQHIKRGLGAETPTRNKLYPAMSAFGVENFTFEIVEECSADQLDKKEDEWQEYFHAKDFGYSIK